MFISSIYDENIENDIHINLYIYQLTLSNFFFYEDLSRILKVLILQGLQRDVNDNKIEGDR